MYRITLTPTARRDLAALPVDILRRVDKRILALTSNPRPNNAKKLKGAHDLYRIRVGTYRIIYEVQDRISEVTIARIRHRRDVFRNL
jgi:mRNA interferase RelE/StbE